MRTKTKSNQSNPSKADSQKTGATKSKPRIPSDKGNSEIFSNIYLEGLIHKALFQWKREFENDVVRTDSIGDLEKLIKLNILVKDENQKTKEMIEKIMLIVIDSIKSSIEESDKRIKIFEKLKEIDYDRVVANN